MKEEIINYLSKTHDAQTLIQINDALNLHSAIELKKFTKSFRRPYRRKQSLQNEKRKILTFRKLWIFKMWKTKH